MFKNFPENMCIKLITKNKETFEEIELNYMDCDSFFFSFKTKVLIKDLNNLEDYFDQSNVGETNEQYSKRLLLNLETKPFKVFGLIDCLN